MPLHQSITGRPRYRYAQDFWQTHPAYCHLCGYPIDMNANPQSDPLARAIDELIPRCRGGSALDPNNTAPSHRWCNNSRGTHPLVTQDPHWHRRTLEPEQVRERCRTHIEQLLNTGTLRPI